MNRRQVLAATSSVLALAGCLGDGSETMRTDSPTAEPPPETTVVETPTPEYCSAATTPMSRQFVDADGDDEFCYEGAEPSLAIENERNDSVAVELEITTNGESTLAESYDLDPGERIVEQPTMAAHDDHEVRATVDGEESATGSWEGVSCYRHGVAVTSEEVAFGLVPPLAGPGDTMHDCYAGDDAHLNIYNGPVSQSVTLRVLDRCADSTVEETFELEPEEVEHANDVLIAGGNYDVTIEVAGGSSETYEFREQCWGLSASIEADGSVSIRQILID